MFKKPGSEILKKYGMRNAYSLDYVLSRSDVVMDEAAARAQRQERIKRCNQFPY